MSKQNVASVSRHLILKNEEQGLNLTNEALAAKVVELFAEHEVAVKTSASCIAWYKNKMRKEGQLIGRSVSKSIEFDLDTIEL